MSSDFRNVKRAASAGPPTTHHSECQILKRAASVEPQLTNRSKRQKLLEQDDAEEEVAPNIASENTSDAQPGPTPENRPEHESEGESGEESGGGEADPGIRPNQSSDDEADQGGGEESGANPDARQVKDLPAVPRTKIDKRSKWDKDLDRFVKSSNKTGRYTHDLRRKGHNNRLSMTSSERRGLMEAFERMINVDSSNWFGKDQNDDEPVNESPLQSEHRTTPEASHNFVASSFAPVDDLQDSASLLGIDLSNLENITISPSSNLKLRADQVQNIAFMVKNAEGILQGAINSNPNGTGKTIEALASVFFLAQRRRAQSNFDAHKATLVLTTHQALRGWQQAHAQFFSNLLTLYVCTKSSQNLENCQEISFSAPDFAAALDGMDSSDPSTSYKVILCTFDDFSSEEFLQTREAEKIVMKREFAARSSQLIAEAHEALIVGRKPLLFDLVFQLKTLKKIGTLIADEAHEIKDPRTRKAQATYLVNADFNLLITASPADNRISDFRGLLFLLFKPKKWGFNWPYGVKCDGLLDLYSETFDPLQGKDINEVIPDSACPEYVEAVRRGQHLWRLNPHAYRWLGNKMKFNASFSRVVLGAIFRLVVLRRDPNSMIEYPGGSNRAIRDIIGIPKTTIKTVELKMPAGQQNDFYDLANPWFSELFATEREEKWDPSHVANSNEIPDASFDQTENARLSYITADYGLSEVFRLPGNSFGPPELLAADGQELDPDAILDAHEDAGMTFYYTMTRHNTDPLQPPVDRMAMIRHLVRRSPKLQWLLVALDRLKQKKEKAIIFCRHPRTQWLVEGVCAMAEFDFYSLNHDHHKDKIRPKVIADFNKPTNRLDFLLGTMELLGHGYDLSQDCHHMIVFELPNSIPQILSAIGRIRRVGQTSEQEVSLLTLAGSYDDYTLHRQYKKFAIDLWASGIFGRWPPGAAPQVLAAGEIIRRQLGSRVNRSLVVWECKSKAMHHGKWVVIYKNVNLERFAAARFKEDTLRGKSMIDDMLASRQPGNASASASSGAGDPAGGSDDPEDGAEPQASAEQDGEEPVMDEAQPQVSDEQDDADSVMDME